MKVNTDGLERWTNKNKMSFSSQGVLVQVAFFFIITMIKGDYWVLAGKKIHPKCQNFATYLIVTCFAMHSTVPMMEPSSQTVIRIPLKSIGLPQGNTNFKK